MTVDFLGTKSFVDRERIGVLGVCGSGSFGLAAAETDPRIKAVATVSMYDIGQAHRQGLRETVDTAALKKNLAEISQQRWAEVDGAPRTIPRREPTERDVQIEILFCGICHSDLHQVRNEWSAVPTV